MGSLRLLFVAVLALALAACGAGQTFPPTSKAVSATRATSATAVVVGSDDLQSIDFLSRTDGVGVTDSAFPRVGRASSTPPMWLTATSDGGVRWYRRGVALPQSFWGAPVVTLAFLTTEIGFADNGTDLIATTDAGLRWQAVRLGDRVALISLIESTAWAIVIGCPASAANTPHCPVAVDTSNVGGDGPGRWATHRLPLKAIPAADPLMARPESSLGIITDLLWNDDNKNPVMSTDDGGLHWRDAGTPCGPRGPWVGPGGIAAENTPKGATWWLLCYGGAAVSPSVAMKGIERSSDGGVTWTQLAAITSIVPYVNHGNLPNGDTGPFIAVSPTRLWLATADQLSDSNDGGRNWTTLAHDTGGGAEFGNFSFVDDTHGWLVAPGLGLWRTVNGSSWHLVG